jgi:hypothetical protein
MNEAIGNKFIASWVGATLLVAAWSPLSGTATPLLAGLVVALLVIRKDASR